MHSGGHVRAVLTGLVAGLAGGLFGVGGGILLVPLLTGGFGLTQHEAHGTSLAAIGAAAISGLIVYGAHGNVNAGAAAIIGLTSIAGARLGARGASGMSKRALTLAFAVFVLLVAARLFWKAPVADGVARWTGAEAVVAELVLGLAIGLLSGFMGVGGGILAVPALTLLFGFAQQQAQGTSLAVILLTAPFGAWEHARRGNVVRRLVPWLALGAAVGAPVASSLVQRLPQAALVHGFAWFLLANAVFTIARTVRARQPA